MVDDVGEGVDPFLHGEAQLVVHRADVRRHLASGGEVGRVGEADGEAVQARPPGLLAAAALHPPRREAGGGGGDEGGVEAAREQHAVMHVAHELRLDGALEGGPDERGPTRSATTGTGWCPTL